MFVSKTKPGAPPTPCYSSSKGDMDPSLRLGSADLFEKVRIPSPSSIR